MPTLLGILPYAGLKFYFYQLLKNRYRSWQQQAQQPAARSSVTTGISMRSTHSKTLAQQRQQQQKPQKLPVLVTLVFGGSAGLLAQTVTYPLVRL